MTLFTPLQTIAVSVCCLMLSPVRAATPDLKQMWKIVREQQPRMLRATLWVYGTKSAWILDEIGKEEPIIIGVLISEGRIEDPIEDLEILTYRESRGWEVRHFLFVLAQHGRRLTCSLSRQPPQHHRLCRQIV
jgi:hypothetical protein